MPLVAIVCVKVWASADWDLRVNRVNEKLALPVTANSSDYLYKRTDHQELLSEISTWQ